MDKIIITEKSQKDTGMAITLLCLIVGFYIKSNTAFIISAGVLLVTMMTPKVLKYPAIFWFGLSDLMGNIMSKVLLTFIFFFIISPIALLIKIMGKDQLRLRNHDCKSAFIERMKEYDAQDLKNPF